MRIPLRLALPTLLIVAGCPDVSSDLEDDTNVGAVDAVADVFHDTVTLEEAADSAGDTTTDSVDTMDVEAELPLTTVDLTFCDDVLDVAQGTLCAVQPSKTDPAIQDYGGPPILPGRGFGFHAVGIPSDLAGSRGVWVHFGGAFGNPYFPAGDDYATREWLSELVEQGFVAIQMAYSNGLSVNGDLCLNDSPIDNCAGLARREILEGVDHSEVLEVDAANGVYGRLHKLTEYLQAQGIALPDYFQPEAIDWSQVRVSGHSQGAGHAYYVAKNVGVKSACFLGGPYDKPDAVGVSPPPIADWYKVPGSATEVSKMGAFLHTDDSSYNSFTGAYNVIGLVKDVSWFDDDGTYLDEEGEVWDGHAASAHAPQLKAFRAKACFEAAADIL